MSALLPGVPRRLDDLIARCLAKDRTERLYDLLMVVALLEALLVEQPCSQRPAEEWRMRCRPA